MTLRTFIALELPPSHKSVLQEHLAQWKRVSQDGINWVHPENLHLTLLFIGDTPAGELPVFEQALGEFLLRQRAYELQCLGYELFPATEPRLLWAKLHSADKRIFALAKELAYLAREYDLQPDEKHLKLHVTIGRIKQQQPTWREAEFLSAPLPESPDRYDTISLYRSDLHPDGPVYTALQQYQLR